MKLRLPIMTLFATPLLLALPSCAEKLSVRPAIPICPEPITLPRSMTDPLQLPAWFPAPKPMTTLSSQRQGERPKCTPTPKR